MNKKICLLLVMFLSLSGKSFAGLKMDISASVSRVVDTGGDAGESAGVTTDVVANLKEVEQSGIGPKVLAEKAKMLGNKEDVMDKLSSTVPGYGEETFASKDYDIDIEQAQDQFDNTPSQLKVKVKEADTAMQERRDALYQVALGKKQEAEKNIENLEALYEQAGDSQTKSEIVNEISEYEKMIEQYEADLADLESENSQILQSDEVYQEALNEKETANAKLAEAKKSSTSKFGENFSLKDVGAMKAMSPQDKTAEYNKVIKENFLLVDEPEDAKGVTRVKKKRAEDLVDAIAKAIVISAKFKNSYVQKQEDRDRAATNMMGADYQVSSIGMAVEQNIQEVELLQDYNKLLLANMRVKTARDMVSQDYRLKNYEKDPASLNLDNYTFTDKDITSDAGEKDFLSNVKAK